MIFIFFLNQAYTSGCNIVILSSNFERVEIISGNKHNNSIVRCIDCTFDTGKVKRVIFRDNNNYNEFIY